MKRITMLNLPPEKYWYAGCAEYLEAGVRPGGHDARAGGGDSAHHARAGCAGGDAQGRGPGTVLPGAGTAHARVEGGGLAPAEGT